LRRPYLITVAEMDKNVPTSEEFGIVILLDSAAGNPMILAEHFGLRNMGVLKKSPL